MKTKLILVIRFSGDKADFINLGTRQVIKTVPTFEVSRRGKKKVGFHLNGKLILDPYKAIRYATT